MFRATSLLAFLTLSLSVIAERVVIDRSPILSLPLKKIHNLTSGKNLVASDLARVKNFKERLQARDLGEFHRRKRQAVPVVNEAVSYVASVGVGADDTQYSLIVDTGSSNTWVGAGKAYVETSTSVDTGDEVLVEYGSGAFEGIEFIDRVTITSSLVIEEQSIGVAEIAEGFEGVDGIIGIGPEDLTEDTVEDVSEVPTVTQNLFSQGTIPEQLVSVSFEPTTSDEDANGELFFGGTDSTKFTGDITFTPRIAPYWGISQSVSYAGTTILSNLDGIVDTGTTLLYLVENSFDEYIDKVGGTLNEDTGLYQVTTAQFDALEDLIFTIGGTEFSLTPNAQIWPRSLNTDIGGAADDIFLIVNNLGAEEDGFNFINGQAFLERFYAVFDTTNNQVGLATTPFTDATTN